MKNIKTEIEYRYVTNTINNIIPLNYLPRGYKTFFKLGNLMSMLRNLKKKRCMYGKH